MSTENLQDVVVDWCTLYPCLLQGLPLLLLKLIPHTPPHVHYRVWLPGARGEMLQKCMILHFPLYYYYYYDILCGCGGELEVVVVVVVVRIIWLDGADPYALHF